MRVRPDLCWTFKVETGTKHSESRYICTWKQQRQAVFASSYWLICLAFVTSAIKWHLIREPILSVQRFHHILLMMRVLMHLRFTFWRAATQSFSVSHYEDEPKATSWRSPLSQQCRLLNQASEWASASFPGLVTNFVIHRPRDEKKKTLNDQSSTNRQALFP